MPPGCPAPLMSPVGGRRPPPPPLLRCAGHPGVTIRNRIDAFELLITNDAQHDLRKTRLEDINRFSCFKQEGLLNMKTSVAKPMRAGHSILTYVAFVFVLGVMKIPSANADVPPVILYKEYQPECSECTSYEMRIFRNGRVVYEGTVLYRQSGIGGTTVDVGVRETMVSTEQVEKWIDALLRANFFSLLAKDFPLGPCPLDRAEHSLTLSLNENSHTLSSFYCLTGTFPMAVHQVAGDLRNLVQHHQWRKKTMETKFAPQRSQVFFVSRPMQL